MEYHFEEQQHFKLILYDIDDDYHIDELYKQEYMGETEFCLAELLRSGSSLELPLMKEGMLNQRTDRMEFKVFSFCLRGDRCLVTNIIKINHPLNCYTPYGTSVTYHT